MMSTMKKPFRTFPWYSLATGIILESIICRDQMCLERERAGFCINRHLGISSFSSFSSFLLCLKDLQSGTFLEQKLVLEELQSFNSYFWNLRVLHNNNAQQESQRWDFLIFSLSSKLLRHDQCNSRKLLNKQTNTIIKQKMQSKFPENMTIYIYIGH